MGQRAASRRKCPKDSTPLVGETRKVLLRSVEVDVCPKCRGLFLDEGEIRALTGHRRLNRLLMKRPRASPGSPLACPHCERTLAAVTAGGMRVDVCPRCYGVWLDAHELDRLRKMRDAEFREFTPAELGRLIAARGERVEGRDAIIRDVYFRILLGTPETRAPPRTE